MKQGRMPRCPDRGRLDDGLLGWPFPGCSQSLGHEGTLSMPAFQAHGGHVHTISLDIK